jgi:cellulose synthase/poly-beta-1,6-N-acetylglucosamine synthase-like glycosyltransferase
VLAIVPAHNEEAVILETVYNLEYSGCTVVVVADRCTDSTVEICKREGFLVFEVDQGNKGRAINEFLNSSDLAAAFEGVAVVDCGTVVGASFAGLVIEALQEAPYVQGWLRSSGRLAWVNAWYSWNYALYHLTGLGRDLLGFSAMIGGTGFAWRSVEHVRFDDRCLVEDLELSLRLHSAGIKVAYADLQITDEKPATLKASFGQRLRWSRGAWWLFFHGRFLTWRLDDFCAVWGSCSSLFWGLGLGIAAVVAPGQLLVCVLVYMVIGSAGMVRLGQLDRFRWSLLISVPMMTVFEAIISVCALVTFNRKSWTRTSHSVVSVLP